MLEDTLVIWGGEFGRTVYCQGPLTATDYGRDHHRTPQLTSPAAAVMVTTAIPDPKTGPF
jgi:hypothetical protein